MEVCVDAKQQCSAMIVVECLGNFCVTVNGNQITRWRAGKARQLFQYLLLRDGRLVTRDYLNELFWPKAIDCHGSTSLKVAVHGLRQVLNEAQETANGGPGRFELRYSNGGYVLKTTDVWMDFKELERHIQAGRRHEQQGQLDQAKAAYLRSVELGDGDFLPDENDHWVIEQREWLRDQVLWALEWLSCVAMEQHDYLAAMAWSRRMLDVDPYREETYQRLMTCHARLGQLGRVKRWYDLCEQRLSDGLGVRPQPTTLAVMRLSLGSSEYSNGSVPRQGWSTPRGRPR